MVPILKPGKDAAKAGSYRPIALTTVICKLMERMVTDTYLNWRTAVYSEAKWVP